MRGAIFVDISNPPPVNVAFDIIVRFGETEHVIGQLYAPRAGDPAYDHPWRANEIRYCWLRWNYTGPPLSACEVVLRSSKEVARRTVDLFEIWEGELVYPDVDVRFYPREPGDTEPGPESGPAAGGETYRNVQPK